MIKVKNVFNVNKLNFVNQFSEDADSIQGISYYSDSKKCDIFCFKQGGKNHEIPGIHFRLFFVG